MASVRCVTAPVNTGSIAFHTRMGFQIEKATGERGGVPCTIDYDGADFTVCFFAPYVADALSRIDGDEIIFDSDGAPVSMTDARLTVFRAAAPVEGFAFVTVIAPAM